jgi:hypothetical protein
MELQRYIISKDKGVLRLIEAIKFCNYIQKNFSKCNMGSTKNENNYKNLDIKYL